MSKEIKDRLDKLENELKESKNEIHNLKSSASFKIERGVRKLLSRFSRKQINQNELTENTLLLS